MERKIYLYDRGFWVLFRMLGIFAAALSLFLTLCFIMWIREWAFLLAILAGIVATVALLMHSRCTKRQYVVLADGRLTVGEAFGQVEKTFPLDAFPYAYLYTDAKYWETVVLSKKPLTAGRIRGLFQLNLANRRNDIVRIPCSFTKQGREIRAYFAGVYARKRCGEQEKRTWAANTEDGGSKAQKRGMHECFERQLSRLQRLRTGTHFIR